MEPYGGTHLNNTCKINYVRMQHNYVKLNIFDTITCNLHLNKLVVIFHVEIIWWGGGGSSTCATIEILFSGMKRIVKEKSFFLLIHCKLQFRMKFNHKIILHSLKTIFM